MAIRTTESANRMMAEAVLMTTEIRDRLNVIPSIAEDHRTGVVTDTGVMAAQIASTLIATFGNTLLGNSLFEEVDDATVPPANLTTR